MGYLDKVNMGDFFSFQWKLNERVWQMKYKKNIVGTKHLFIAHNVSFNQIQSNGQAIPLCKITNKNNV